MWNWHRESSISHPVHAILSVSYTHLTEEEHKFVTLEALGEEVE